jgi:hypothetical protein
LKGNGDHNHLIILVWFVFSHPLLHFHFRFYLCTFSTASTVCVTGEWVGVDNA